MATLVSELRKVKNAPVLTSAKAKKEKPVAIPVVPVTQNTINVAAVRKQQTNQSAQREFGAIKLGDLPPVLRTKFLRAQTVFYQMIELKFVLNDLPAKAQKDALKIQLDIEALDDERDLIWKHLHHWKAHKTLLDVAEDDFSTLDKFQLDLKRRNLRSNISSIKKRIDRWYDDLINEPDAKKQKLIEQQINSSEKRVFKHELNINKLNKLIKE